METKSKKEKVKLGIYDYLKGGMSKKDSAVMSGISEATFYRWIDEDESFESLVEANILKYKQTLIQNINRAAEKDGRLALEVLTRRFPNEWNPNRVYDRDSDEESIQKIADLLQRQYETTNAVRLGRHGS